MNLVWHIIKKDIRRVSWVFVMWAVTGGYLIGYGKFTVIDRSIWDNLGIVSLLTHIALTLALIAAIVQEDGLTQDNEFWRTRPISPGRVLAAKLGLILVCFAAVPIGLIVWLHPSFDRGDLVYVVPIVTIMALCCMAVASCTKDLGRYFLGGVICVMTVAMLETLLSAWFGPQQMPKLNDMYRFETTRTFATFGFCGIAAVALLLNQYFTRRTAVSIGIALVAIVGVAPISSLWGWWFIA